MPSFRYLCNAGPRRLIQGNVSGLLILLCILGSCGTGQAAGAEELEVIGVHRLTPLGRNSAEIYYGIREPWNLSGDRLMYHESSQVRWAYVADLKSWTTEAEYDQIRHSVPSEFHLFIDWSIFPGEENIMYGAHMPTKTIASYNVDTGAITQLVSYDPGDGRTLNPYIKGWTKDGNLVVHLNNEVWSSGVYEVDVKNKTRIFYANAYYPDPSRWPDLGHGHGDISPDWSMKVSYYGATKGQLMEYPSQNLIRNVEVVAANPKAAHSHASWRASNEWWIADDSGENWYASALAGNLLSAPHIETYRIYQCWTDGTSKTLFEQKSAGPYKLPDGSIQWSYQAEVIPVVKRDGLQIVYTATGNNYTTYDRDNYGKSPALPPNLYLLDLAYVAGGNIAPIANASSDVSSGDAPLAVNFSSAGSSDSDGTIASYAWNLGDGTSSAQANPAHTYTASGSYTVTLTVTDDDGATDSATLTIMVNDVTITPPLVTVDSLRLSGNLNDPTVSTIAVTPGSSVGVIAGVFSAEALIVANPTLVTITATDQAGNTNTRTLSISP